MALPVATCLLDAANLPALEHLRQILSAANYTEAGIASIIGDLELPARHGGNLPRLLHAAAGDTPLHTLVQLFIVGVPVNPEAARRAFHPLPLRQVAEMGLVTVEEDAVRAAVSLVAWKGLLLACDPPQKLDVDADLSPVMSPWCRSTHELVQFSIRRPSARVLDLGTGCGILAILAASHSEEVIALDLNPRAVSFASFNSRLNGRSNVTCLQGDRFEPVRGQRFDLILCNPPFVISPSRQIAYRDSGEEADTFCRELARQVPAFLNENGYFQMIFQWIERTGEDSQEVLARWFADTGCDVWVLGLETSDPSSYAEQAMGDTAPGDPEAAGRLYDQWTDYYRRNRVAVIATGLAAMRRCSGRENFLRVNEVPQARSQPYGEAVGQAFDLCQFLGGLESEASLLQEKLRLPDGIKLVRQSQWGASGWEREGTEVQLPAGLQFNAEIDEDIALLFSHCNGERTLQDLLQQVAAGSNRSLETVIRETLPTVLELVSYGFLIPVRSLW